MAKKTDNRTVGNHFEYDLSQVLAEHGFWVHMMTQSKAGQPADLIAVKGKFHTLIDCKVISDDRGFPFERIEENQRMAMRMFHRKCGELCWFALRLPDQSIWFVTEGWLQTMEGRKRSRMTDAEIRQQAWPLEKWMEASNAWAEDV